jgi:hypothetical protein
LHATCRIVWSVRCIESYRPRGQGSSKGGPAISSPFMLRFFLRAAQLRVARTSIFWDREHPSTEGMPNLVKEFLRSWACRLANPKYQSRNEHLDCGMIFRETVPNSWIINVETLPDSTVIVAEEHRMHVVQICCSASRIYLSHHKPLQPRPGFHPFKILSTSEKCFQN